MDIDLGSLPPNVGKTLRKYFLLIPSDDGGEKWRETSIKMAGADGKPIGAGPVLDPEVIQRFLELDTTPDKAWFDWMLLHSGGGSTALKRSETLLAQTKVRFIDDRIKGYRDKKTGKVHPPVPKEQAQALWQREEQNFHQSLIVGDQDLVYSHQLFGFYRHWPGKDRIYERIAVTVQKFLGLRKKIDQMNRFYKSNGHEDRIVSLDPNQYDSLSDLQSTINRVERFFASKAARQDVRLAQGLKGDKTIYSDDFLTVRVPLTYAAAVKYGWPTWAWSNPNEFESGLESERASWQDPWRKHATENVPVFIEFNVPMPSWVVMGKNKEGFRRHSMQNISFFIPHSQLKSFNPETIPLYDEETEKTTNLATLKKTIREEGARQTYDPEEEEYPIKRGPSVFASVEQAEEVVQHLDAALDAVKDWASQFNPKQVVSDYMKTEKRSS